jgi:hypothetical protein
MFNKEYWKPTQMKCPNEKVHLLAMTVSQEMIMNLKGHELSLTNWSIN